MSDDKQAGGRGPRRGGARRVTPVNGGAASIRQVPVATVLDWAVARWTPKLATTDPGGHTTARTTLTLIGTLRSFWAEMKVGEIRQANGRRSTVDQYVENRTSQEVGSNRRKPDGTLKKVSPETAWSEVGRLMAEVREYAATHEMWDVPEVLVPTRQPRTAEWVTRSEVARLLWAVRGRQWDFETKAWKVDDDGRRVLAKKRDTGWMARLILILVYTGSTAICAARFAWDPSEDGKRSHFDLDSEIEGRTAHLLRLGPDMAAKRMAGVPVAIPRRLAAHLRRWRQSDGGNHERVLHLTGKGGNRKGSAGTISIGRATIARLFVRAGVNPEEGTEAPEAKLVDLPTLSDTAAVWALRAGSRKIEVRVKPGVDKWRFIEHKPSPAIMRSASLMVGVGTRDFRKRFDQAALDYQEKAMRALSDPAATVR